MSLETEIRKMYYEIESYGGDFGDAVVDSFSFDPWEVLCERQGLSEFESRGAIVGMLVHLMSAIDNSTHAAVLNSSLGGSALRFLESDLVERFALLKRALEGFSQSEEAFALALRRVYLEWVQPVTNV